VPTQTFYLILGIPVVVLSLIQLLGVRFHIPPEATAGGMVGRACRRVAGRPHGDMGAADGPLSHRAGNAQGQAAPCAGRRLWPGSVSLLAGHVQSGVLNLTTLPFSVALLIPAFLGMQLGFRMSDRLNPELFRKITLIVLIVAGANLVRRGLMG
jgi:hypothetical protein